MKWLIKAIFQKTISFLPGGKNINYFFQKKIYKSLPMNNVKFMGAISEGIIHYKTFEQFCKKTQNTEIKFYEFGAGWDLTLPILFSSLGVKDQTIVDLNLYIKYFLVNESLKKLKENKNEIEKQTDKTLKDYSNLSINNLEELKEKLGIKYIAPYDARKTDFKDNSFDFISNTATLEHIPYNSIYSILKECRRILKKDGVISCIIDLKDHYSYFDSSISCYNFLKYSNKTFSLFNSDILYQNRMRYDDYIELFKKLDLNIVSESVDYPSENDIEEIKKARLNNLFERYNTRNAGIKWMHIVLKKNNE